MKPKYSPEEAAYVLCWGSVFLIIDLVVALPTLWGHNLGSILIDLGQLLVFSLVCTLLIGGGCAGASARLFDRLLESRAAHWAGAGVIMGDVLLAMLMFWFYVAVVLGSRGDGQPPNGVDIMSGTLAPMCATVISGCWMVFLRHKAGKVV